MTLEIDLAIDRKSKIYIFKAISALATANVLSEASSYRAAYYYYLLNNHYKTKKDSKTLEINNIKCNIYKVAQIK